LAKNLFAVLFFFAFFVSFAVKMAFLLFAFFSPFHLSQNNRQPQVQDISKI